MSDLTGAKAFELYASKEELGMTPKALCFGTEEDQTRRLDLAAGVAAQALAEAETAKPGLVVDLGAGFMDLYPRIEKLGLGDHYVAVEYQEWMLDKGVEAYFQTTTPPKMSAMSAVDWLDWNEEPIRAVFALGLIATFTPNDLNAFAKAVKQAKPDFLIVSWLNKDDYKGRFNAWTRSEIESVFGGRCHHYVLEDEVTTLVRW